MSEDEDERKMSICTLRLYDRRKRLLDSRIDGISCDILWSVHSLLSPHLSQSAVEENLCVLG